MKHIIYLILLCICTMSCKVQTNNYAVISGTIHVKGIDSIYLENFATNFKKAISVNNGSFNDTITIDKARAYNLIVGKKMYNVVYLQNGFNLNISINNDLNYDSAISFSGVGADVNNYYKAKKIFMLKSDEGKTLMDIRNIQKLSQQDITTLINKINDSLSAILNNAQIEDKNFRVFEKENISWDKIDHNVTCHYIKESEANRDTTKTYTPSPGFLPQAFLNFKSDNEDLFINSSSYFRLSRGIPIRAVFSKKYKTENVDENIKFIDSIYNTINIIYLKDVLLKTVGSRLIANKDKKIAKTYLDYFTSRLSDENTKTDLVNNYNKYRYLINAKQRLKKGALSPKFVDYENFAGGTTSLDDLKGKYVYIDVWATWCGPCKKEIPFLQDVEKKYHNKNIAFVSISVDEKPAYDIWRKMVEDDQLTGLQLFADNTFQSKFVTDYGINGIPRFILIDPEGKIIDSNAPRPSEEKLIDLFNELGI